MKIPITVSRSAVLLMVLVVSPVHAAAWQFNLPRGVTEVTHSLWWLHMMMFWVVVALGSGVFLVMLYSIIRHRKSRGVTPARFHENTAIEIIWTIIPVCILIAVAIPAAGTLLYVEDSSNADLTIRVTGYQWLWEYKYVDSGVHFTAGCAIPACAHGRWNRLRPTKLTIICAVSRIEWWCRCTRRSDCC